MADDDLHAINQTPMDDNGKIDFRRSIASYMSESYRVCQIQACTPEALRFP